MLTGRMIDGIKFYCESAGKWGGYLGNKSFEVTYQWGRYPSWVCDTASESGFNHVRGNTMLAVVRKAREEMGDGCAACNLSKGDKTLTEWRGK